MKSNQSVKKIELLWPRMIWLAIILAATAFQGLEAATNLVIWDTGSRFGEAVDAEKRSEWKAVPSELFVFEAEDGTIRAVRTRLDWNNHLITSTDAITIGRK